MIYRGDGKPGKPVDGSDVASFEALYKKVPERDHPSGYHPDPALRAAVNVALLLQQPLLVTGEPGTGKTRLAWSVAYDLGLPPPLEYRTKTSSTAADLLYRYDSLGHFRDVQLKRERQIEEYITYSELGQAIREAAKCPKAAGNPLQGRSVVLVDEIDKAPRDFPNDLLADIETMSFRVRETGEHWEAPADRRPIVILTSNSEKSLPDAFLRRCAFHYIQFPSPELLAEIVGTRLNLEGSDLVVKAVAQFETIRKLTLRKPPATAELMAWIRALKEHGIPPARVAAPDDTVLDLACTVLTKYAEDGEQVRKSLKR